MSTAQRQFRLPVRDYALGETLRSGQAFRWYWQDGAWEGIIGSRFVRLSAGPDELRAETAAAVSEWGWLRSYLQTEVVLERVLATFPQDEPMRRSVAACRGLRLLRQEPWECLASFVLSSNKQIVQIQQIIAKLCRRWGDPVTVPPGHDPAFSFPGPERLSALTEAQLRACQMGYRAPHLLAISRLVAQGAVCLDSLASQPLEEARAALLSLPGVGPKIADCVLLFAGGFPGVFPMDVWIRRALRQLYFPRRPPGPKRLREFVLSYFGAHAGYAQQYLFHYVRVAARSGPGLSPPPAASAVAGQPFTRPVSNPCP